jgi:hypothetical protein
MGPAMVVDDWQKEVVELLMFSIPPCRKRILAKTRLLRKHAE